jgi:hypothetical protein
MSDSGTEPISMAAMNNDAKMVRLLVHYGADPNECETWRETPIFKAAENGAVKAMKALIDVGADVNWRDENGFTAMFSAAENARPRAIRLLQEHGVSLEECSRKKNHWPLLNVCHKPYTDHWIEQWESGVRGGLQPPPPEKYERQPPPRSNRCYYARLWKP